MGRLSTGICWDCDDPVVVLPTGWYNCRSCGYESLRSNAFECCDEALRIEEEAEEGVSPTTTTTNPLGLSLLSTSDTSAST